MKKTFKRPDGTEEVLEGTPKEIAEYEQQLEEKQRKTQPKGPGLLTDGLERLLRPHGTTGQNERPQRAERNPWAYSPTVIY